MDTMKNLKIVALKAENIKKLVAVEIRPDGNMVELTGKNGQGKTSVLDAISWALEGAGVIQGEPIRKGQAKAWVSLDLGEIIVKRTFKKSEAGETTSSITVESKDGARFPTPQAMLDSLMGKLAFDPLAFARMSPKEQFDSLKKLVPGVDFEEIERLNRVDFERRTNINRKAKEARAAVAALAVSEEGPTVLVNVDSLVSDLEKAGEQNAETERRKARREAVAVEIKTGNVLLNEIIIVAEKRAHEIVEEARLKSEAVVDEAKKKHEDLAAKLSELQGKLDAAPELPEIVDLSSISKKIEEARVENIVRLDRMKKVAERDEADRLEAEAAGLTEAMQGREKDKREKVAAAKLPVQGLTFGEGAILMNGVPFEQASDAEQLRASIAIAMNLNPRLRVIRVRDGSLLDERSMALLSEMAKDQDYQVWIERVDGSGKVGFVLEDGHVKSAARELAAAK